MTAPGMGPIAAFPVMRGHPSAVTAAPADRTPAKTERIFPDAANTVSRITTDRLFIVTAAMTTLRTGQSAALPVMRGRPSAVTAVPAGPTRAKTERIFPVAARAVSPTTAGLPSAVTPRRAVTLPAADTAGTAAPPLRQTMTAGAGTGSASPSRSAGLSMRRTSRIFSAGASSTAATGTM